jgi:DNA-binding MurR/RpiR family transcriptional regulator
MNQSLIQRLEQSLETASASGRVIATYMLSNLQDLPFQTAASIAEKLGLSESSVGRYCRSIGYNHLKDLKNDLKENLGDNPWLVGDRLQEFRQSNTDGPNGLSKSLELEMSSIMRVYEYALTNDWQNIAARLATTPYIFIAGFQTERGLAVSMTHLLQYIRPGVHLVDGASGNFSDVLLSPPKDSALIVFEARRYSNHALKLCAKAKEREIPTTIVTDTFCDWAATNADEVFRIPTEFNLFWESSASMLSWVHLMVNEVCRKLGPDVEKRLEATASLHNEFVGYTSKSNKK